MSENRGLSEEEIQTQIEKINQAEIEKIHGVQNKKVAEKITMQAIAEHIEREEKEKEEERKVNRFNRIVTAAGIGAAVTVTGGFAGLMAEGIQDGKKIKQERSDREEARRGYVDYDVYMKLSEKERTKELKKNSIHIDQALKNMNNRER